MLRDQAGRTFTAATTAEIILGLAVMFTTGLLVLSLRHVTRLGCGDVPVHGNVAPLYLS